MAARNKKEKHLGLTKEQMRDIVDKEALAALIVYFQEGGNAPEAKMAVQSIAAVARKEATENNKETLVFLKEKFEDQKLHRAELVGHKEVDE